MGTQRSRLMFSPALELAFVTERGRRSKSRSLLVIAVVCSLWIMMLVLHARTLWALPPIGAGRCVLCRWSCIDRSRRRTLKLLPSPAPRGRRCLVIEPRFPDPLCRAALVCECLQA